MIINVTESMFRNHFHAMGRGNQFSYEALGELFRYYEEMEDATGEPFELDVIALCCDWNECDTDEMIASYGYLLEREEDWDDDDYAQALADLIRDDHGTVISLGGYSWLVSAF